MNLYTATIHILPHRELLDPQGKAVANNMKHLNISGVQDVRIGKHIIMQLTAASAQEAHEKTEQACKQLLANPIMETYEFSIN